MIQKSDLLKQFAIEYGMTMLSDLGGIFNYPGYSLGANCRKCYRGIN